jgi:hypothetical protein
LLVVTLPSLTKTTTNWPPIARPLRRPTSSATPLTRRSELAREKAWSRIYLVPAILAEQDRDSHRRSLAALAREKEIMKDAGLGGESSNASRASVAGQVAAEEAASAEVRRERLLSSAFLAPPRSREPDKC